jgi:HSP20 family protein
MLQEGSMKVSDEDLEKDLERMRQHMREKLGALARPGAAVILSHGGWRPSLDLYETKEEFIVLVDVPGVQPQDVEVVVDRDILRIAGNRCRPVGQGITRVHQMEIDFGAFSHAIRLPEQVNSEAASSTYRDGFLTIRLPKRAKVSGPISITVSE